MTKAGGGEVRCKSRTAAVIMAGALLLAASAYLAGCGSQAAVQSAAQPSTTIRISQDSDTTATSIRTITSSTELIPPPMGSTPVMWLMNGDAPAAGIQIDEARGGPGPVPGELYLKARVAGGQAAGAYEAIAQKILTLAEKRKQQIYFDRLRVVLAADGGAVLYDHTFQVTAPSSTTSTTQPFTVLYSAPRLQVGPREGVRLTVTIIRDFSGPVTAMIEIRNSSGSAFRLSSEDLQLYLDSTRVREVNPSQEPPPP